MTRRTAVPAPEATSTSPALDELTGTRARIVDVPLDRVHPHPANPRRDLGDLTELADSIRAHGVRQNLLVVPDADELGAYRLVIGHRRTAAARLAGLDTLPAVIDPSLDAAAQLELMLLENLQRSDLSPVEEADGYQGLLDLGLTEAQIAAQVGRSRATVKARLTLVALPPAARNAVHIRAATLEDAAALGEFDDDPTLREQLAGTLGTDDFRHDLSRARNARKAAEQWAPILAALAEHGVTEFQGSVPSGLRRVAELRRTTLALDADAEPITEPVWNVNGTGLLRLLEGDVTGWRWSWAYNDRYQLTVYRTLTLEEAQAEADADERSKARAAAAEADAERRAAERARNAAMQEFCSTTAQLRADHLRTVYARKKFTAAEQAALVEYVGLALCLGAWEDEGFWPETSRVLRWLGTDEDALLADARERELDEQDVLDRAFSQAIATAEPTHRLLAAAIAASEPVEPYAWRRDRTRAWYALMAALGYQASTDELAALAGPEATS